MGTDKPGVIILAGPNGAGKTTSARTLLAETLSVMTYVNADVIAQATGAEAMRDQSHSSVAERFADRTAVEAALGRAVREAVLGHALAGHPIAIWRDGQVVWLEPAEVLASYGEKPLTGGAS
jgi:predicted ABC-type ATPase